MSKVIVIVTKSKDKMLETKKLVRSICHFDHGAFNYVCSRVDNVRYYFLNLEQHSNNYLRGITIDKLYFIMNAYEIPREFIESVYPTLYSSGGKIIHSEKFNLNLLVS
ncbi:MAG: hypothetical protein RSC93_00635 [Erysipelotrichaceae bacterium]